MPAYLICQFEAIGDRAALERYLPIASASVAKFGGKYLIRAEGIVESVEGSAPKHVIVIEFADAGKLREWYHSEDYSPALEIRGLAGPRDLFFVEGA